MTQHIVTKESKYSMKKKILNSRRGSSMLLYCIEKMEEIKFMELNTAFSNEFHSTPFGGQAQVSVIKNERHSDKIQNLSLFMGHPLQLLS